MSSTDEPYVPPKDSITTPPPSSEIVRETYTPPTPSVESIKFSQKPPTPPAPSVEVEKRGVDRGTVN